MCDTTEATEKQTRKKLPHNCTPSADTHFDYNCMMCTRTSMHNVALKQLPGLDKVELRMSLTMYHFILRCVTTLFVLLVCSTFFFSLTSVFRVNRSVCNCVSIVSVRARAHLLSAMYTFSFFICISALKNKYKQEKLPRQHFSHTKTTNTRIKPSVFSAFRGNSMKTLTINNSSKPDANSLHLNMSSRDCGGCSIFPVFHQYL